MIETGQLVDGKYRILRQIGKGGMSVVYLALNEKANKTWAIKEVRKDGVQDFNVVKQGLVAEIDMLKKLSHPNLPSIIDVIDSDDSFLIVMDYIEGVPLDKRIKEMGAQDQDDVIEWAIQLCDVLGYLHSRKPPIIYRDMKPSNVMLKPEGDVTLIDFGTAREFKESSVEDTVVLGTRGYAAPEQYGGHGQTDARTDIYCLGATMYHLVTGHNPSAYPYEMYPIRKWNSLLSSGLEKIILKCTQKNPEERYQSCAELMYALEHYKDEEDEAKKQRRRKLKSFIFTSAACIVMALSAGVFKVLEISRTSDNYDIYINRAVGSDNMAEASEYFRDAQKLDPSRADVYLRSLEYYTSDGKLNEEELDQIAYLTNNTDALDGFKSRSPKEYAQFCYDLASRFYFSVEDEKKQEDGRLRSVKWFKRSSEMKDYLDSKTAKRADIMVKMSDITAKDLWGKDEYDNDPNEEISYQSYWNMYIELIFGPEDLAQVENVSNALSIYNSFVNAVKARVGDFYKKIYAKDGTKDIIERMDQLERKVNDLKNNSSEYKSDYDEKAEKILKSIKEVKEEVEKLDEKRDNSNTNSSIKEETSNE